MKPDEHEPISHEKILGICVGITPLYPPVVCIALIIPSAILAVDSYTKGRPEIRIPLSVVLICLVTIFRYDIGLMVAIAFSLVYFFAGLISLFIERESLGQSFYRLKVYVFSMVVTHVLTLGSLFFSIYSCLLSGMFWHTTARVLLTCAACHFRGIRILSRILPVACLSIYLSYL